MNSKKRMGIAIALVVILVALVGAIFLYINNEKKSVAVYDFSRNITYDEKSNYQLTENDIVEVEVLAADVREDYITDPRDAVGKYLAATGLKGQHILKSQLSVDPTYIDKSGIAELAEYRKFYLPLSYGSGFAGDIASGQLVDILFTEKASGYPTGRTEHIPNALVTGIKYYTAKIIMQSVPVYQVYTANGSVYKRRVTTPEELKNGKEDSSDSQAEPAYVALTVTVDQYEELAARKMAGDLSLVSRFDSSTDVEAQGHTVIKDTDAALYSGQGNLEYDPEINMEDEDLDWEGSAFVVPGDLDVADLMDGAEESKTGGGSINQFITTLQKFDLTDAQRTAFRSIFARYQDMMSELKGTDWAMNEPETVTDEDFTSFFKDEKLDAYKTWKEDTEKLAKEVQGEGVVLPW